MEETNNKYKDIFNKSPLGILFYDKVGKLIDANSSALKIAGVTKLDDLKSLNLFDNPYLAPKKEKLINEGMIKFQSKIDFENIQKIGFYNSARSGTGYLDYDVSVTDFGFLLQIQDITEPKKIEEAYETLKESEEKFREIFNRTDDMISLAESSKDSPSKYVEVNKVGCERLGYTKDEFLNLTPSDIIAPEARAEMGKNSAKIAKNGHDEFEIVHIAKNGERIPVEVNLHSFKLRGKEVKLAFSRDISKRKKIGEISQANEEKFHTIFQSAPSAIGLTRLDDGVIVDVNNQFTNLFGYTKEEVIGKTTADLGFYQDLNERKEIFEELQQQKYTCGITTELPTKSGDPIITSSNIGIIEIDGVKYIIVSAEDITERKRMEEQLKYQASLLDNVSNAIIATDLNQVVTSWNKGAEKLYGYKAEEMIGNVVSDVIKAEFTDEQRKEVLNCLSKGYEYSVDIKQYTKDGEPICIEGTNFPIYKEDNIVGYVAVAHDITERKKMEESLRESEEKFHTIFQSAPFAIGLARLDDGVIVDINKQFTELFGYTKEDAVGKTTVELGLIRNLEDREQVHKKLSQQKYDCNRVTELFKKSGEPIIGAANFGVIEIGGIKHMLVSGEDITKRKKMEEKLRESEEKFHTIYQSAPSSIALTRLNDGVIVDVNNQFTKLFGYTKEEVIGKTAVDLGFYQDFNERKEIFEELQQQKYTCGITTELPTKSGELIITSSNIGIIEIDGIKYILVSAEDITERRKAEKALKEAHGNLELQVQERTKELEDVNEELKVSNEELQHFAYITSHDLQEPLRTIASFTQLLEKRYKGKLDSDADEFMSYIVEAAIRMKQMINDLLEYSKVGTDGKEFHLVDMKEVLNEVIFNLNDLIERSQAEITYSHLPFVIGEKDQLQRVFQNLIGNAIKFKKPDEFPKVHISAEKENDEYIFSVQDNGIGMERQHFDRIFTVFQRLHTKDEYHGTGIGLSIAKKIIEHHGGRIWVESGPHEGSTFYFTLPISESNKEHLNIKRSNVKE